MENKQESEPTPCVCVISQFQTFKKSIFHHHTHRSILLDGLVEKDVCFGRLNFPLVDLVDFVIVVLVPLSPAPPVVRIAIGCVVTALHRTHVVANTENQAKKKSSSGVAELGISNNQSLLVLSQALFLCAPFLAKKGKFSPFL